MNLTYLRLELLRVLRDPVNLFFTALLPAFLYLIFSNAGGEGGYDLGHGNVAMYVMVSMAAYGAVTATTGIGGTAAVERMQGWGRQLGLTPLTDAQFVATKALVGLIVALVPIGLVYGLGAWQGAEGEARAWGLSALVVILGAILFALYGLAVGLAFRSESAVSAASGGLVVLAFMGNLFFPLGGTLLQIARFTPLYGYAQLARYPITDGTFPDGASGEVITEALWIPLTNVLVWTLILAALCVVLVRRGRERQ